jgi:hypothetical protein
MRPIDLAQLRTVGSPWIGPATRSTPSPRYRGAVDTSTADSRRQMAGTATQSSQRQPVGWAPMPCAVRTTPHRPAAAPRCGVSAVSCSWPALARDLGGRSARSSSRRAAQSSRRWGSGSGPWRRYRRRTARTRPVKMALGEGGGGERAGWCRLIITRAQAGRTETRRSAWVGCFAQSSSSSRRNTTQRQHGDTRKPRKPSKLDRMGAPKSRNIGESQSVRIMNDPIVSTCTRMNSEPARPPAGRPGRRPRRSAGTPASWPRARQPCSPCVPCACAGGDNAIVHDKNWLRFPYMFILLRSHYLLPHP